MIPRDYASAIDPHATPERLNQIEIILRRALADEACRLAALIDEEDRWDRIRFPGEASQLCRKEARIHLSHT